MKQWIDRPQYSINIVAIYDMPKSGRRIHEMFRRLKARFTGEIRFHLRLWQGDLIGTEVNETLEQKGSAHAELLAVAFENDGSLQSGLLNLAWEWASEQRGRSAAIVVIPSKTIGTRESPMVDVLRRIAARNNLEFLCAGTAKRLPTTEDFFAIAERELQWESSDTRRSSHVPEPLVCAHI